MNLSAAVRHHSLLALILILTMPAFASCAQPRQETGSDRIHLRFDYAGARALFDALNRRELSPQDIAGLYDVQGLAAMVDNVTRYIPEITRHEFEQDLLRFIETREEPRHKGHRVWGFEQVLATRAEVEELIARLDADEAAIIARTLRVLEPYRPDTGPLAMTVCFVVGGVSDGFVPERSREPSLYVNLARARRDLDGVVSNLTHEIYHVMQQTASRRAGLGSTVDDPEKLAPAQRLLATTLWEGSANYAADPRRLEGSGPYLDMWRERFAQNTTPAKLAEHFALFETVLNDLQAGRMSWDDAYARGFSGPQSPFYFVGYQMTKVIDERCGQLCVRRLFNDPPAAFFRRYIEIYKRDAQIAPRFSPATQAWIVAR
jgi:hypothetical protein